MPVGFEVYAPTGRRKLGTDTAFASIIGISQIGGEGSAQSGSFVVPRFALGEPFFFMLSGQTADIDGYSPSVWISGGSIYWSYRSPLTASYARPIVQILYGIT